MDHFNFFLGKKSKKSKKQVKEQEFLYIEDFIPNKQEQNKKENEDQKESIIIIDIV